MIVAKIAAIDSSTITHSGSATEDGERMLSLARGHLVGDVYPHVEVKQAMPDGQLERRSKVARDFPRSIKWMLECRATRGAQSSALGCGPPRCRFSGGRVGGRSKTRRGASMESPDAARWTRRAHRHRALAWRSLSSTARHGMDRVRGVTRSAELAGHIGTVGSRDGAGIAHVAALYLIDRRRTV